MSKRERELMQAMGQVAHGFNFETIIGATSNLLRNCLRQSHPRLGEAEERLDAIVADIKAEMRRNDYHEDGTRNDRIIVLPSLRELLQVGG